MSAFNGAMALQPWIPACRAATKCGPRTFNGAMALQPWIPACRAATKCGPRTFNGAMALQPWILPARPAARRRCAAFNGAMALQPWILPIIWVEYAIPHRPSMEPWPFSHGYDIQPYSTRLQSQTFNGAMALQPWILLSNGKRPNASSSFNGAMALQPWIHRRRYFFCISVKSLQWSHGPSAMDTSTPSTSWAHFFVLQWSHGPSAMDTRYPCCGYASDIPPSMEPWPFSHGYRAGAQQLDLMRVSFNGAMALQPWIPD